MNVLELVDDLYGAFAERLGEPLTGGARDLPRALRLAPDAKVPWSRVFAHEVTLGAPALWAEAMPRVPSSIVRDATLAHLLAVIDAFGTDRVEDEQVEANPEVLAILGQARRERDRAMARVFGGAVPADYDYTTADVRSLRAIRAEHALLLAARPVDIATYERASLDKQSPGLLAATALAERAGWAPRRRMTVRRSLEAVALGLQIYDDVVDWEDDMRRGGSWVVCLVNGNRAEGARREPSNVAVDPRPEVLQSGVLGVMLRRARWHMRTARRLAMTLGARRLAAWATSREARFEALVAAETTSAGYAARAHALAAWASEVLA